MNNSEQGFHGIRPEEPGETPEETKYETTPLGDLLRYRIDSSDSVIVFSLPEKSTLASTEERTHFLESLHALAAELDTNPALDEKAIKFVSWDASSCDDSVWRSEEDEKLPYTKEIGFTVGDFVKNHVGGRIEYESSLVGMSRKSFLDRFGKQEPAVG